VKGSKKFEYMRLSEMDNNSDAILTLNNVGQDGWQLVHVQRVKIDPYKEDWILMREIVK